MKIISILALLFVSVSSFSQTSATSMRQFLTPAKSPALSFGEKSMERSGVVLEGPRCNFSGSKILQVTRTLSNPTDSSISFRFTHMPQVDSDVIAYLFTKVTATDFDSIRYQLICAAALLIKSPYFVNNTLFFNGTYADPLLFAKEESPIGFIHGVPETQCGNYARFACTLLMATGFFTTSDFQDITVPGHSICQIKLWNRFVFTDFDPGEPGFIQPNPHSPNGMADIYDLRADTNLISTIYYYNGELLCKITLSEYRHLLLENPLFVSPSNFWNVAKLNGTYTIPPHSTVNIPVPRVFVFVDTSDVLVRDLLYRTQQLVELYTQTNNPTYADSVLANLSQLLGVSQSEAMMLMDQTIPSQFVVYNSILHQGLPLGDIFRIDFPRGDISKWNISFQVPQSGLVIGSGMKVPGYVLSVENSGNGQCVLQDTSFFGSAQFHLWDESNIAPWATHQTANYLDTNGYLGPGSYTVSVSVNGNTRMICVLEDWIIEGDNAGLLVNTVSLLPWGTTSVGEITQNALLVYPSPVNYSEKVYIPVDVTLYTIGGQYVLDFKKGYNTITQPPGCYVVRTLRGESGRLVVR